MRVHSKNPVPARPLTVLALVSACFLVIIGSVPAAATTNQFTRVSVSTEGVEGNGTSGLNFISADGRFVAYASDSNNLVEGDTNGTPDGPYYESDVFLHDRSSGTTTRISVSTNGIESNGRSFPLGISADGRYTLFSSTASNLVDGDTNGVSDLFVHDRITGSTNRISLGTDGREGSINMGSGSITADGRYVAFVSLSSNFTDHVEDWRSTIYVHDLLTGETTIELLGENIIYRDGGPVMISGDGRYIAFQSLWNLVPEDTNGRFDIYVLDRVTREVQLASIGTDGSQGENHSLSGGFGRWISDDGRFVVFYSESTTLVPGDTNGQPDVFVRDLETGETHLVTVSSDGVQANAHSGRATISPDGRYIVFFSRADNLVEEDFNPGYDVFLHDQHTSTTSLVSSGVHDQNFGGSSEPTVSLHARSVAFDSDAKNLVPDDNNNRWDVFVTDLVHQVFDFDGFFPPIENPPYVNVARAGRSIPIKFALEGASKLEVLEAGYPKSREVSCDAAADNTLPETVEGSGESALRFDEAEGLYIYNWKTDPAWSNTCRTLDLKFIDGSQYSADFYFGR